MGPGLQSAALMGTVDLPTEFKVKLEAARQEPKAFAGAILCWVSPDENMACTEVFTNGGTPEYPAKGWYIHHIYTGVGVHAYKEANPELKQQQIFRMY